MASRSYSIHAHGVKTETPDVHPTGPGKDRISARREVGDQETLENVYKLFFLIFHIYLIFISLENESLSVHLILKMKSIFGLNTVNPSTQL